MELFDVSRKLLECREWRDDHPLEPPQDPCEWMGSVLGHLLRMVTKRRHLPMAMGLAQSSLADHLRALLFVWWTECGISRALSTTLQTFTLVVAELGAGGCG